MSSKLWSRIVCICQCPLSVRIRREYATEYVVSEVVSRPERVLSDILQMLENRWTVAMLHRRMHNYTLIHSVHAYKVFSSHSTTTSSTRKISTMRDHSCECSSPRELIFDRVEECKYLFASHIIQE